MLRMGDMLPLFHHKEKLGCILYLVRLVHC